MTIDTTGFHYLTIADVTVDLDAHRESGLLDRELFHVDLDILKIAADPRLLRAAMLLSKAVVS